MSSIRLFLLWNKFINFPNFLKLLTIALIISNFPVLAEDRASNNRDDNKKFEQLSMGDSKEQKKDIDKMSHKAEGVISLDATVNDKNIYLLVGKNIKGQITLWLQTSKDNAASWSPELKIPIPESSGATISRGSDAKIVKSGKTIFIVWMSHVEGARFGSGPMVAMRSLDEGKSWERVQGPADWLNGPHGFFSLTSSKNTLHATWLDKRDGQLSTAGAQGLRYAYSQDGGKSWSKNITLDEVVCACCWTNSISDVEGNLYVLYRDKEPSDMALGLVNNKDHKWNKLSTVGAFNWEFSGCPHIGGSLAIKQNRSDKELHALIGTRKQENAGIYHFVSSDGGKNWQRPEKLGDSSATHGDMAIDRKGEIYIVWDMVDPETNDGSMGVYLARSKKENDWSNIKKISRVGYSASHPRIISTKDGELIIWTEKNAHGESFMAMKKL